MNIFDKIKKLNENLRGFENIRLYPRRTVSPPHSRYRVSAFAHLNDYGRVQLRFCAVRHKYITDEQLEAQFAAFVPTNEHEHAYRIDAVSQSFSLDEALLVEKFAKDYGGFSISREEIPAAHFNGQEMAAGPMILPVCREHEAFEYSAKQTGLPFNLFARFWAYTNFRAPNTYPDGSCKVPYPVIPVDFSTCNSSCHLCTRCQRTSITEMYSGLEAECYVSNFGTVTKRAIFGVIVFRIK